MSSLLTAIHNGDVRQFHHLLATDGMPRYPLDYKLLGKCLHFGRTDMARVLIENGCNVDAPATYRGNSPLHLAVQHNVDYELVESLVRQGAVVSRIDPRGDTALHLAFVNGVEEMIVDLLLYAHLHRATRNEVNLSGLTFLHIAATRPDVGFIQCFVEAGKADINCQVNSDAESLYAGYTPLHMAVEFGRLDVAELLLIYGADLYVRDVNGSTPLHLALERRDEQFIDLLFEYDTERVNYVNRYGLSHFMAACACDHPYVVGDFLNDLSCGRINLDVSAKVDNGSPNYPFKGYTPLHVAVEYGRLDTVRLLLANGARLTPTYQGHVLGHVASKNEFHDIVRLIELHEQHYEAVELDIDVRERESDDFDFEMEWQ